ncbi:MAG: 23S rRNA (pseudouridine(1915)-N(3))-methyltransferase RlmH [Paludibacteraceae bacterium]|jgi:23S rRNA (pseudouridine1915-N3)-methyltransferase|nr:23S rRNA (pseudouridine(1915)-N(3))-methyltransferase RlmH [Paludibacteraceae bacterium]MBQ5779567.1 23S rRNA (pseudouridine(1915)-N(3))-methyltransferase RlmH [Paludibacteraceae bacterium]
MKIHFLVVGKTTEKYMQTGIDEYVRRLLRYIPFSMEVLPELKNAKNLTFEQQKEKDSQAILNALQDGDYVVLLDEKGKEYSSVAFSDYLARKMQIVPKRLVFVVGGPYGFSAEMYDRANEKLSVSKMTFSHQMIRLIFVEQLYRAMTILRGEPYHHE